MESTLTVIVLAAVLLALAVAGMGIRIWIKGKFADTEIGGNKNMRKLGIMCAKEEEMKLYKKGGKTTSAIPDGCSSCCSNGSCRMEY